MELMMVSVVGRESFHGDPLWKSERMYALMPRPRCVQSTIMRRVEDPGFGTVPKGLWKMGKGRSDCLTGPIRAPWATSVATYLSTSASAAAAEGRLKEASLG